jgi:ketosteroid isomerase-like protein
MAAQQNVELVHRAYDAFNRRDLDAFLEFFDPEVELTARFMELEGSPYYRGHDGIREWWRRLLGIFPDFRAELLEVRDFGDRVIAPVRVRGHGAEGGVPIDETLWQAIKLRDGRATWWRNFATEAEAVEAAGLRE